MDGGTLTTAGTWSNSGTLAMTGGSLTTAGTWTNSGTIDMTGGTLTTAGTWANNSGVFTHSGGVTILGGTFSTSGLGNYSLTDGGTGTLTGTITNNGTISLAGDWILDGATVTGGTVAMATGSTLSVSSSSANLFTGVTTSSGVTFSGNLCLSDADSYLQIHNGMELNGTATLSGNGSALIFDNVETLQSATSGGGTVVLDGSSGNEPYFLVAGGATLTIGNNIIVKVSSGSIITQSSTTGTTTVNNDGAIIANGTTGQELYIAVDLFTNSASGSIEAQNDSLIDGNACGSFVNSGTIRAIGTAVIRFWNGTSSYTLSGAAAGLSGTEVGITWSDLSGDTGSTHSAKLWDGTSFIQIGTFVATDTAYVAENLEQSTTYTLQIETDNPDGSKVIYETTEEATTAAPDQAGYYRVLQVADSTGSVTSGTRTAGGSWNLNSNYMFGSPLAIIFREFSDLLPVSDIAAASPDSAGQYRLNWAREYFPDNEWWSFEDIPVDIDGTTIVGRTFLIDLETYNYISTLVGANPENPNGIGGNPGNNEISADPIRYADGSVDYQTDDLISDGLGQPFGQSRNWSSSSNLSAAGNNGTGMINSFLPHLLSVNGNDELSVVIGGTDVRTFDFDGSTYVPLSFIGDKLQHIGTEFVYTDTLGTQTWFFDYSTSVSEGQRGQFESAIDAAGNVTVATVETDGKITEVQRKDASGVALESWLYSYIPAEEDNAGLLENVKLRRTDGAGGWTIIRQVDYTYYTGTVADYTALNGSNGDLETATIEDADGNPIDTDYYRYYVQGEANGYTHGLKYVLDGDAFARLSDVTDPFSADDSLVAEYADHYFQYDDTHRVTLHTVQGAGASDSGGLGTFTYSYFTGSNADGTNSWRFKTIETLPDGNQNVVYCNSLGEVMLKVLVDYNGTPTTSDDKAYPVYYQYDDAGRILWTASSSALGAFAATTSDSSWESYSDLVGYSSGAYANILPNTGRIDVNAYYGETAATTSTAGGVAGYLWYQAVQQGYEGTQQSITSLSWNGTDTAEAVVSGSNYLVGDIINIRGATESEFNGSFVINAVSGNTFWFELTGASTTSPGGSITVDRPIISTALQYKASQDDADAAIYPVASKTVFQNTDQSNGQTTYYDYIWYAESNQVKSVATTYPIISEDNHGSVGSADTEVIFYDLYGRPIWTKDAEGHINYTKYDVGTGAVVEQIVDVTYASLTEDEQDRFDDTGWADPMGGLNLVTQYMFDGLGRTTKMTDPDSNITYTVYNDVNHEVRIYQGWQSSPGTTTGPIEVIREYRDGTPYEDANGNEVGLIYLETLTTSATPTVDEYGHPNGQEVISASNIQSLTRSLTNNAGQVVDIDEYFSMSGLTYSQSSPRLDPSGTFGSGASNDSASGNYSVTLSAYDDQGRLFQIIDPTGTITHYVFDARGNILQTWVGTSDTNQVETSQNEYDVDGNLTQQTQYPGGGDDRVTQNFYDWRDRLVATKVGVQDGEEGLMDGVGRLIYYYQYNNLNQIVSQETYAADDIPIVDEVTYGSDGVTVTDPDHGDGVPDRPDATQLRALTITNYDEQGRIYRTDTYSVDPSDGTPSEYALHTDIYYDPRGNIMEIRSPGGLVTETVYDGADRPIIVYQSDGAGGTAYTDAGNATGDHVLSQFEYTYDGDGNVILTADRERFSGAAATGPLGDPLSTGTTAQARAYYTASYYDAANRPIAGVDLGTLGGLTLSNWNFETPNLGSGFSAYQYGPTSSGWAFESVSGTSGSGVAGNGSGFTSGNPNAPEGDQVAFLQGSGTMSQSVTLEAGQYTLTFDAAKRQNFGGTQSFDVTVDGTVVGSFTPSSTAYGSYSTASFAVGAGTHTIEFVGTTGTDNTDFIDEVKLQLAGRASEVPTASDTALVTGYSYDDAGRLLEVTDPNGIVSRIYYDLLGRTTTTIADFTDGTPTTSSNQTTEYTYDGSDHILTMTAVLPSDALQTTKYIYGDSPFTVSGFSHSGLTATITVTGHHYKLGQSIVVSGSGTSPYYGTFTITAVGTNTINYVMLSTPSSSPSSATVTRNNGIFSNDLLTAVDYPDLSTGAASDAQQETFTYNALGEQRTYTDRNGTVHAYSYDVLGRMTADTVTTLDNFHASVDKTVLAHTFTFDSAGNAADFRSLGGDKTVSGTNLTFDSGTGKASITLSYALGEYHFQNGDQILISGADQGQYNGVFTVMDAGSTGFSFAITGSPDSPGSGTIHIQLVVNDVLREYNGLGQLTAEYQSEKGAVNTSTTPVVRYVYDEMADGANESRQTEMIYPDGRILHYVYSSGIDDSISRLSYLADDDGSGDIGTPVEEYTYLGLGTVVELNHPEALMKLTYIQQDGDSFALTDGGDQYTGLDRFGRVIDQNWVETDSYGAAVGTDERYQYGYDRDGNVLWRSDLAESGFDELYTYDSLNRLVNFARGTLNSGHTAITGTAATSGSWTLDANGNWTSVTTDLTTENRTYNAQNELTSVGNGTMSYDGNGDYMEGGYNYDGFGYDAWHNAMTGVETTSPEGAGYSYDALGRRISTTTFAGPVIHLYYSADGNVIEERINTSTSPSAQYVWSQATGTNALVERDRDTDSNGTLDERLYDTRDVNGDVTALISASTQAAVERYVYSPYGSLTVMTGSWGSRSGSSYSWLYLYQGGRYDWNTGLYHFGYRDYDPNLGRWLQQDPMGYVDGMNSYQMEMSNPILFTDTQGTDTVISSSWGAYPIARPSYPISALDPVQPPTTTARRGDETTANDLGLEFGTGKGYRAHYFDPGTPFSNDMANSTSAQDIAKQMAIQIASGKTSGQVNHVAGLGQYAHEYPIIAFASIWGWPRETNQTDIFVGGYVATFKVLMNDKCNRRALVEVTGTNISGLQSLTRIPGTRFHLLPDNLFGSGHAPFANIKQTWRYTTEIHY